MDNLICAKCKNPMEMAVRCFDVVHPKNNKILFNYFARITCQGCGQHYDAEAMDADEAIRKVFDVKKSVEESDPNG